MAKFKMTNVKITATDGGSVHNYDDVEITDSTLIFEAKNIDFTRDESLAIIDKLVEAGYKEQISEIIKKLDGANFKEQEDIIKKSFLTKVITGVKEIVPIVNLLLKWSEINN